MPKTALDVLMFLANNPEFNTAGDVCRYRNIKAACRSFVILQPFGCLPNHVVGRGISKRLKEMYPDAQILPLDYDPDVSFANIENRLQMLIMNAKSGNIKDKN